MASRCATDAKVVSATTDQGQAAVRLADGSELTADLVVGADGVHSKVRRAIDPAAPTPRYVGLTNFGGITRDTALASELADRVVDLHLRATVLLRRPPDAGR